VRKTGKIHYFGKYGGYEIFATKIGGVKHSPYCSTKSKKRALEIAKKLKKLGYHAKVRVDPATRGKGRKSYIVYVPRSEWSKVKKKKIRA